MLLVAVAAWIQYTFATPKYTNAFDSLELPHGETINSNFKEIQIGCSKQLLSFRIVVGDDFAVGDHFASELFSLAL